MSNNPRTAPYISKFLKISPNEIENAVKNERNKWQQFRVLQVRAQAKEEAAKLQKLGKDEELLQKEILKENLKKNWEKEHEERIQKLVDDYEKCKSDFGEAHKKAEKERKEALVLAQNKVWQSKLAKQRSVQALQHLNKVKYEKLEKENILVHRRQKLKEQEKLRSQKITKLPLPDVFKPKRDVETKDQKKVILHEHGTFTTSTYRPSAITVQKETPSKGLSAHELASIKIAEEKVIEMERIKEEEERRRLIEKRGKEAQKRQKLKEMRNKLLEELDIANEKHELSDFLKGEKPSIPEDDLLSIKHKAEAVIDREKEAEHRVEELLKKENYIKQIIDQRMMSPERVNLDRSSKEQEKMPPKRVNFDDSQDIHLKSTIPVHKLPILKDKFEFCKPADRIVDGSVSVTSSSEGNETSEENKQSDKLMTSTETEYLELSNKLKDRLQMFEKEENVKLNSSIEQIYKKVSSTSSSETLIESLPDDFYEMPCKHLRKIEENRLRCEKLLKELNNKKEGRVIKEYEINTPNEFHTIKTPIKIYSEEIKSDGSGQRPLTRREKFERCKKAVIELYVKKLLAMKREDIKQLSTSSVEGSGFELLSGDLCNLLTSKSDLSEPETISTISTTPTLQTDDIDTIPVKLSSLTQSSFETKQYSDDSCVKESEISSNSSNINSTTSSYSIPLSDELRQEILARYRQVEQMKLMLLSKMRHLDSGTPKNNYGTKNSKSSIDHQGENSITSQSTLYSTLSEDSTTSAEISGHQQIYSQDKSLEQMNLKMQSLLKDISQHITETTFADSYNKEEESNSTSMSHKNTDNSMPDMVSVLERFGLTWARSMNRKMDEAEGNLSSDSNNYFHNNNK